jgi:hypothetical protein
MKSHRIFREDVSSGDSGEDYDSEEGLGSVTRGGRESGASRIVTSKQKGKQPEKRRNAGKLSKLPGMPLDVLYEVSPRFDS